MSDRKLHRMQAKACSYLMADDDVRLRFVGGYPNLWRFADVNGKQSVIIASADEFGRPDLSVVELDDFIASYEEEHDLAKHPQRKRKP